MLLQTLDNYEEVLTVLIAGGVMFIATIGIMIFILLFYQKKRFLHQTELLKLETEFQKALLQSTIETQEATFSSLGKELHDNIGQLLGTAKMLIGVSQRNLSHSSETIRTADETLSKAIHELRSLSKTLNKEWLEQFNFKQNLETEINRINTAGVLRLTLHDNTTTIGLSADQQIILFRIVQEALQNAIKHSEANEVILRLTYVNELLQITITDNGKGFSTEHAPEGVGILNMKHRTALLNGTIRWQPRDTGTFVIIQIPIQPESA